METTVKAKQEENNDHEEPPVIPIIKKEYSRFMKTALLTMIYSGIRFNESSNLRWAVKNLPVFDIITLHLFSKMST